jgi:hypothetical protein
VSRVLYRVVKRDPPTVVDFTSNEAQDKPLLHDTPRNRRLWSGLSCFATEAQARWNARRFPGHGNFIARLEIDDEDRIQVEKTRGPGHYTLWAEPADLLGHVRAVVPV